MRRVIVLGVTVDLSLVLMEGFPEALVARGWEVHIVSSPGPRLAGFEGTPGVMIHPLKMNREASLIADGLALVRWWLLLRRIRPDVISVGTPKASLLGLVTGFLACVPHRQYLVRGLRLETATGFARGIYSLIERLCVVASTDVVAISASLRARMISLGLAGNRDVAVLGSGSSNGVDLTRYDPKKYPTGQRRALMAELGLLPETPIIGFVGRLARDKGVPELLASAQHLHNKGVKLQLLLVGGTENDAIEGAVVSTKRAGINVVSTGAVEDVASYMSLMDVLCMPSKREGFGNAALEAAAMNVPVVATAVTGLVDAVEDHVTGLLSAPQSTEQLAEHLESLLSDRSLRERMGRAGREMAEEKFDRQHVQPLYLNRIDGFVDGSA